MKDAEIDIEVKTHILANSGGQPDGVDVFQRDSAGGIVMQQRWYDAALRATLACTDLPRAVSPADVIMNPVIQAPVSIFKRWYNRSEFRTHEAVLAGTRLTLRAIVAQHVEREDLMKLFDRMGAYVGLSPCGHNLGYGNFSLLAVRMP